MSPKRCRWQLDERIPARTPPTATTRVAQDENFTSRLPTQA